MIWYFRFKSTDDLTWERVNKNFSSQGLENVLGLFDLILSLPPTSLNNETAFSAMKLTKGKRRGRMNTSTLNNCLLINKQAASIEQFNPDRAIQNWLVGTLIYFWCFNATFSNIMATSFSGGRSWSTRDRTTDHGQVTGKPYNLRLRVECILFCNLQSGVLTHSVLACMSC